MTFWRRWVVQPQTVWLRKATFQIHLWTGIALGLYVFLISLTGSVLVYRNELYVAATRDPIIVTEAGSRLTDEQLRDAAKHAYPEYAARSVTRPRNPNQAVDISLERGNRRKLRLFNPYTGADLGDSVPLGIKLVSKLLELHDDLLGGPTGRIVNAFGALAVVLLTFTGVIIWWPGIKNWRRSLLVSRKSGWPRFIWSLHSMLGFWSLGFVVMFGISGVYLGNPELFQDIADWIDPLTGTIPRVRWVDQVMYWLAYLHVGRINGIALPCKGPGVCDSTTKLVWAIFGLAPAAMFVTGAMMWWNRVGRRKLRQRNG